MDKVRSLSDQLLQQHPDRFTTDFAKNKEALAGMMTIRSKQLRNRLAGFITAEVKRRVTSETAVAATETNQAE